MVRTEVKTIKIRPYKGKKIRDPRTGKPLPHDRDVAVIPNSYWLRRLRDKDVYEVKGGSKKSEPKSKKKSSSEEKVRAE